MNSSETSRAVEISKAAYEKVGLPFIKLKARLQTAIAEGRSCRKLEAEITRLTPQLMAAANRYDAALKQHAATAAAEARDVFEPAEPARPQAFIVRAEGGFVEAKPTLDGGLTVTVRHGAEIHHFNFSAPVPQQSTTRAAA